MTSQVTRPVSRAVVSDDGRYRYTLSRDTGVLGAEGTVLFVMLNPSTADATEDDPTIRRCLGFARDWGYARLLVGNLYAYRATDPRQLLRATDPVGVENDHWLDWLAQRANEVIVAWGGLAQPYDDRARRVLELVEFQCGTAYCLGQTKALHPRHPLYVRADAKRIPFKRYARVVA